MRKLAPTVCLIGLLAVTGAACIQHEGELAVLLTSDTTTTQDGAVEGATQVNVEVTAVAVRDADSGEFVTLSSGSQVHELLSLEGRSSLLALANQLDEGTYSAVRLRFSEANSRVVTDAGRMTPLVIEPTLLTVPTVFRVIEDTQARVTLVLDITASVAQKANGTWVFRPVIRREPEER